MNKPPRTYTIEVPTKSYLRKYITAKNGGDLQLNYNTTLGTLVLCLLEKDYFSINMNTESKDVRISYMTDKITFVVRASTMYYKGFSLSNDKIIAINRYMENEFAEELHKYCQGNIEKRDWRPGRNKAVYTFAEKYGIDLYEDISFEALKKAEYRFRIRSEKKPEKIIQSFVHSIILPAAVRIA